MITLRNLLMIVCVLVLQTGINLQAQACSGCMVITSDNAQNLTLVQVLGDGVARDLAWSADGSQLAVASSSGLYIFDSSSPEFPLNELILPAGATRVTANTNGWIAGTGNGTVLIVGPELVIQQQLTGHIYPITTLEIGGQIFLSVDQSGVARQWSLDSMTEMSIFQTRGDGQAEIAVVNPHSSLIAYIGTPITGGVFLNDEIQPVGSFTVPFVSVGFAGDDRVLGIGEDGGTFEWLLNNPDAAPQINVGSAVSFLANAVSHDQNLRAEGQPDGTVRLSDNRGNELAVLRGFIRGVTSVTFSPDDALLAAGSLDGTARLYDVAAVLAAQFPDDAALSGLVVLDQERGGHALGVTGVAFNDDGTLLATSSFDGTVRLWGMPQ